MNSSLDENNTCPVEGRRYTTDQLWDWFQSVRPCMWNRFAGIDFHNPAVLAREIVEHIATDGDNPTIVWPPVTTGLWVDVQTSKGTYRLGA